METVNKKQQILIVDDEEVNREILKEMFREGIYELIEAENGEDAISKLKENDNIVLVLLDIYHGWLRRIEIYAPAGVIGSYSGYPDHKRRCA